MGASCKPSTVPEWQVVVNVALHFMRVVPVVNLMRKILQIIGILVPQSSPGLRKCAAVTGIALRPGQGIAKVRGEAVTTVSSHLDYQRFIVALREIRVRDLNELALRS